MHPRLAQLGGLAQRARRWDAPEHFDGGVVVFLVQQQIAQQHVDLVEVGVQKGGEAGIDDRRAAGILPAQLAGGTEQRQGDRLGRRPGRGPGTLAGLEPAGGQLQKLIVRVALQTLDVQRTGFRRAVGAHQKVAIGHHRLQRGQPRAVDHTAVGPVGIVGAAQIVVDVGGMGVLIGPERGDRTQRLQRVDRLVGIPVAGMQPGQHDGRDQRFKAGSRNPFEPGTAGLEAARLQAVQRQQDGGGTGTGRLLHDPFGQTQRLAIAAVGQQQHERPVEQQPVFRIALQRLQIVAGSRPAVANLARVLAGHIMSESGFRLAVGHDRPRAGRTAGQKPSKSTPISGFCSSLNIPGDLDTLNIAAAPKPPPADLRSRRLHIGIVWPTAAFWHNPINILCDVLDIASLAVHAVLRVDLQARLAATLRLHDLVDPGRTV